MKRIMVVLAVVMVLTLALGVTSAGAQPMWGPWYHVHKGDTLIGIAMKFHTSPWAIAQANGIHNPNLIYAGQMLFIPSRMGGWGGGMYPGGWGGGMYPGGWGGGMYPGGYGGGMYPGGYGGGMYPGGYGGGQYGMYPGGYGGGYGGGCSWGGSMSWGGYPQYPYWGGFQQQFPSQMPFDGSNNNGGWGNSVGVIF